MNVFKSMVVLSAIIGLAGSASADDGAIGAWMTEGDVARVEIATCADDTDKLCGKIVWLEEPNDDDGNELVDAENPDESLRSQPIVGLQILEGFSQDDDNHWSGGTIYDPESGKTYKSKMTLKSADELEVDGCVLFVCRGEDWKRYKG